MDDIFSCVHIAVYCVENDPDSINRGEPKYLGFVFDVKRSEVGYMKAFISKTLEEYNVPVDGIDVFGGISLPLVKIWTKEKIVNAIKKDADYLISKSNQRSR